MEITMTSTDKFTEVHGVLCREWEGTSREGAQCIVFVHVITVCDSEDRSEFDAELARGRTEWNSQHKDLEKP